MGQNLVPCSIVNWPRRLHTDCGSNWLVVDSSRQVGTITHTNSIHSLTLFGWTFRADLRVCMTGLNLTQIVVWFGEKLNQPYQQAIGIGSIYMGYLIAEELYMELCFGLSSPDFLRRLQRISCYQDHQRDESIASRDSD